MKTPSPKVFISYSHDSDAHAERVLALADRLRGEGIDCILDRYREDNPPPEGWTVWMDRWLRDADFVLVVCTATYYRRVMGEEKRGIGLGARFEGRLILQHIYDAGSENARFIPVLFEYADNSDIPTPLRSTSHYRVDDGTEYERLYRRLTGQPATPEPPLGEAREMPTCRGKEQSSEKPAGAHDASNVTQHGGAAVGTVIDDHAQIGGTRQYGDIVHGDKVAGDKVDDDKITVNIVQSRPKAGK